MKTKKVVTKSTCGVRVPATKAKMVCSKKIEAKKSDKKGACDINGTCAKRCSTKLAAPTKKPAAKKTSAKKKQEVVRAVTEHPDRIAQICGQSERRAQRVELADVKDATISVEALKIGLLLAAIDGHCDKDEIAKFKAVAKSCGGLSSAKIELIVKQMQRRISSLEEVVRNGASEDEVVNNFVSEASNIGVQMNCRNFVFWMSIVMVDGNYSSAERKAITALRDCAKKSFSVLGVLNFSNKDSDVSDMFLKRCEMILAGIYNADATGSNRLLQNRIKSLQTLVEIAEA